MYLTLENVNLLQINKLTYNQKAITQREIIYALMTFQYKELLQINKLKNK